MSPPVTIACEHASNAVPRGVELGVPTAALLSHFGWDPGALGVAEALGARWQVPALAGTVSRLFVDLNRDPEGPSAVPLVAYGLPVPGNQALSEGERRARARAFCLPFRAALEQAATAVIAARGCCLHLSMHSFTPQFQDTRREFDLGVLFDPARPWERAVAEALIAGLGHAGWDARPNEPYLGTGDGNTTWLRERLPGARLAALEIEFSQALDPYRLGEAATALAEVTEALPAALLGSLAS